jgi:hypothetical protein
MTPPPWPELVGRNFGAGLVEVTGLREDGFDDALFVPDAADAEAAVAAVAELLDVDIVAANVVLAAQLRSFTVEARGTIARELADLREIVASLDPDEA